MEENERGAMQNNATEKKIGLGAAIVVGLNAMIGIGIISVATSLANGAGPAGILSYVLSIGVVLTIGLSLGFVSRIYTGDAWNYLYPSQWGGHTLGMISVFSYLIAVVVAMGFLVQQVGIYGHQLFPFLQPSVISIGILTILALLVLAGAEVSSLGQYLIFGSVFTSLLVTIITCWYHFDPALTTPFMPYGWKSVLTASPNALFGLLGFESIASLHPIVENPNRNVGRAAVIAIGIVGLLYLCFVSGILFSIPSHFFIEKGRAVTLDVLILRAFPRFAFAAKFVLIGVVFGIVGTLHSMIWSLSALLTDVLKKMKNNCVKNLITTKRWTQRTSTAVIATSMLIVALVMQGNALVNMTVFFIVPSFILSIMALLFIKKEWQSGRNIITILGLIGGGLMMYFATQRLLLSLSLLW